MDIVKTEWHRQLIDDIQDLEFTGIVITKHAIGKRILCDEDKFGKPEYGSKKIENLAKDIGNSKTEIYSCIQFARQYPEIPTAWENSSWRDVRNKYLPEPRKEKEVIPLPEGKYSIIYADPPWQYSDKCEAGGMQHEGVDKKYPTMSIQELREMDIENIANNNAVLFLWVTSPILPECFGVIKEWGFQYKASFVWDKVKHNRGHYNSVRHEFLLICIRGSFPPQNLKLFDSVQSIERTKHSEKPEKFRKIIDILYPEGKRIELFARRQVDGWDSYGDDPVLQRKVS